MKLIYDLKDLGPADQTLAGGKAVALGRLLRAGIAVPPGICISTSAYDHYLDETGLRERIAFLLGRKAFADMRWEELWDLALRVRHLFLGTPLPAGMQTRFSDALAGRWSDSALTVRSSAPQEDSAGSSFAGLHDSFVNLRGVTAILDHIRLVWASLWSDRALLYRQELSLDPFTSSMAVIVQELVAGECSGVAFSRCPGREGLSVIEVVWGLNQGLVDGDVEPDRILLDPFSGRVVERNSPQRERACRMVANGVALLPLTPAEAGNTPLSDSGARTVLGLLQRSAELFGSAQDLEWTRRGETFFALQSRPITTAAAPDSADERGWYLSLHKSFAALKELRRIIEHELLPGMAEDAARLAAVPLELLDDAGLDQAVAERQAVLARWEERYREVCIPMAHGIRLFGTVCNDRLQPDDPFAFMDLLAGDSGLLAMERNRELATLATLLKSNPDQMERISTGESPTGAVAEALTQFSEHFGDLSWVMGGDRSGLGRLLLQFQGAAAQPLENRRSASLTEADFLSGFPADEQEFAAELLEIGRASYRLRDNDNLYIGRLTARLQEARAEAARRIPAPDVPKTGSEAAPPPAERIVKRLTAPDLSAGSRYRKEGTLLRARQLVGQPAGPGLARGVARVISHPRDLADFCAGEIVVCDAVDPNMTFVVPLSAGIVERRGGMLIHGAIIAREYGLPCVTGVPEATTLIRSGDQLTVDGYLGLVTIETERAERSRY